jgi:hypothetical protein
VDGADQVLGILRSTLSNGSSSLGYSFAITEGGEVPATGFRIKREVRAADAPNIKMINQLA